VDNSFFSLNSLKKLIFFAWDLIISSLRSSVLK
jgi:hypothetical protein